jgi:gluconokinase
MAPGVQSQIHYAMKTTRDGGVEADPETLARNVESVIDEALARSSSPASEIRGVAASCFWHSLVGVGREGIPTTPVYIWADTRSSSVVRELREHLDERAVHARTGCLFHSSYLPAKLLWLSRTSPEVFHGTARWMSFAEYFYGRLFHRYLCSHSMASATGLYQQNTRTWDPELLSFLNVPPEKLSPLANRGETLTGMDAAYAGRWSALRSVPWLPAAGDGACSNIGSGCISPERLAIMVGTSGALRVMHETDRIEIPEGLWCYRADERRFLVGGALSNGGLLYTWLCDTLKLGDTQTLEERLAAEQPDQHGLTFLPFLAGERSMGWHSDARAAIVGLSVHTRPLEILRAGLESVALRFAQVAEAIGRVTPGIREVVASGGALLNSRTWTQIMADVLGNPVIASGEKEASSRGAALLALESLGFAPSLGVSSARMGETFQPHPESHEIYRRARARQERLYNLLVNQT